MKKNKVLHSIIFFVRLFFWLFTVLTTVSVVMLCRDYIRGILQAQYHNGRHWEVTASAEVFSESSKELSNPDRGFYKIYGFVISDGVTDYEALVADKFKNDRSTTLAMLQINLGRYNMGEISESGLAGISALFDALRSTGKRFLVRFLYDWDGRISETEPENIDIILGHMRQLEPILRENSDLIFVMQGLFTGNWGEMNGSRFSTKEHLQALASTLASVTDGRTFLSVRTPYQWRSTTDIITPAPDALKEHPYAWRFGLYNDGILGNITDCGTYSEISRAVGGDISIWNREEELAFQSQLCMFVPNGGETIIENPMNDFENVLPAFRQMHITFLNQDYDPAVLQKWAGSTVDDDSVYNGMDGYTYITRHLGYRLLIDSAALTYLTDNDSLTARVTLRNVGCAPLYGDKEGRLILFHTSAPSQGQDSYQGENISCYIYPFPEDVTALSRTDSPEESFPLELNIPLSQLPTGNYTACFQLWDKETDGQLALAVENPQSAAGYKIGSFTIAESEPLPTFPELPDLPLDLDSRIEEFFRPTFDAAADTGQNPSGE